MNYNFSFTVIQSCMLHDPNERPDLDAVRMKLMTDGGYITANLPGGQNQYDGGYLVPVRSEPLYQQVA